MQLGGAAFISISISFNFTVLKICWLHHAVQPNTQIPFDDKHYQTTDTYKPAQKQSSSNFK